MSVEVLALLLPIAENVSRSLKIPLVKKEAETIIYLGKILKTLLVKKASLIMSPHIAPANWLMKRKSYKSMRIFYQIFKAMV